MQGWITRAEAEELDPEFFDNRGDATWSWSETASTLSSRFGFYQIRVAVKKDGTLEFDRAIYGEARGICAVVYGIHPELGYHIGILEEERPFADDPDGKPADPPIIFGQPCIMGILDKIIGKNGAVALERGEIGALREASEEFGLEAVRGIRKMGLQNPNPAICATWDELIEIEVDLERIELKKSREERIYRAHYLPVREVLRRIGLGEYHGVNYRAAVPNNAFLVWLAKHPEALC